MEFGIEILILLFFVAMAAGWVDSIAGGGGLITLPVLIGIGIPPVAAIATNKFQSSFGTFTSAAYFVRKGTVSLKENALAIACVCVGTVMGSWLLTRIDTSYLNFLVPILLIMIGVYFLFFAVDLDDSHKARITKKRFDTTVAPALGFYDGFFGPGTGSFIATSCVTLRGMPIRQATAHAKLFNFISNISALVFFIFFGKIYWIAGAAMIGGQIVGAYIGARVALNVGAKVIRPLTIIVCFAMSAKALWSLLATS